MEIEKSGKGDDGQANLVLPLKNNELASFITSLLGQQQSIEKEVEGAFDIDHTWLINLHELIDQRITQQSESKLTSFVAVIYFENGLKRTIETIPAFKAYTETQRETPSGIRMYWNYLVNFPGKQHPEKQEIVFSARIHNLDETKTTRKSIFGKRSSLLENALFSTEWSVIDYLIFHTERTWGDDIEKIISNEVDNALREQPIKDQLFQLSRFILGLMIITACLIIPSYYFSSSISEAMDLELSKIQEIETLASENLSAVNKKINHLAEMIHAMGTKDKNSLWGVVILFSSIPIALLFMALTKRTRHSFIVISAHAEKYRTNKIKEENRKTWLVVGSYVLTIATSLLINEISKIISLF